MFRYTEKARYKINTYEYEIFSIGTADEEGSSVARLFFGGGIECFSWNF